MSWNEIYRIVEALTAMPALTRKGCESILDCDLRLVDKTPAKTWYAGVCPQVPVAGIELRIGANSGFLLLDIDPACDRGAVLEAARQLGKPMDLSLPADNLSKEISWIYEINGRRVFFTQKAVEGVDMLTSVAIHY